MALRVRLRAAIVQLTTRRYRRILAASVVTLLTSGLLLGLIGFTQWRGRQALASDTTAVLTQTGQQLLRTLQSRRGTLTFIRDTINRQSDLSLPQLQAMGASAVKHTRHLLGAGLVRADERPVWWSSPHGLAPAQLAQLDRAITRRTHLRGIWRVPSTFVTTTDTPRVLLIMLEPLRAQPYRESALVGVFDVKQFLDDFVAATVAPAHPVRFLDGETVLYQSTGWTPLNQEPKPIVAESRLVVDAARWMIQMQPGSTRVVQTLSWFNLLLIGLCVLAGLGITVVVWLLAARTWILQRAVERRTAALRRASERLRQMATTDELTGLYNRRFFLNRWQWECDRAKRYQRPLACLMIDVNGFKQVNDRLGHQAGDLVLKRVAQELKTMLRQSDVLARFGGDEFIIALPETTPDQAAAVADKLREIQIRLPNMPAQNLAPVSLSVGMSRIESPVESPAEILEAADQSLYAHKRRLKPRER